MRVIGSTGRSSVTIVPEHDIVIKTVIPHQEILFGLAEREIYWLKELHYSNITPILKYTNGVVMVMDYLGETLTIHNAPDDMEEQLEFILERLENYRCCHNDIRPENICLHKDGYLFLIDFGWSTKKGESIPDNWPDGLGDVFKGDQGFNDKHSVEKVIAWINQGKEKLKNEQ